MYNVPLPVSVIRTRMREEFEKHRYVNKLPVVDVLLFQSHAEYQVQHNMGARNASMGAYGLTRRNRKQ